MIVKFIANMHKKKLTMVAVWVGDLVSVMMMWVMDDGKKTKGASIIIIL